MRGEIKCGDSLEVLKDYPDHHFSAVVTDPPYGLSTLNEKNAWDAALPTVDLWREVFRTLKPGGMVLAFGGSRTFHLLACSLELAGFEIRDCLSWLYGTGMPKAMAIDKAIDRQRYDLDDVYRVTSWVAGARDAAGLKNSDIDKAFGFNGMAGHWTSTKTQPAVPTLEQVPRLLEVLGNPEVPPEIARLLLDLNGKKGQPGSAWFDRAVIGTKTGVDLSRARPLGTQFQGLEKSPSTTFNVTAPASEKSAPWAGYATTLKPAWEPIILAMKPLDKNYATNALRHGVAGLHVDASRISGRWPANVVHDGSEEVEEGMGEASRFFYCAKPSAAERGTNNHPTVKPVALMRWLVRMVKMPAGTRILDPFLGSGTTGLACEAEGVDWTGIEREPDFAEIARRRLESPAP